MKYTYLILVLGLCFLGLLFSKCNSTIEEKLIINADEDLKTTLDKIVINEKIPGIVAAIADSNGILMIEAAGHRKYKSPELITTTDRLHLGSCTKAMTSALIATLVQDGLMRWDMTISETFPALTDSIHFAYHDVSVQQLCMHRSGIAANASDWQAFEDQDLMTSRSNHMLQNLKENPKNNFGEFLYSNLGYMIAGHMAEKLTGKTWETLMQERLFDPLQMSSAGFGPPGEIKKINEPWGHRKLLVTDWIPYQLDNAKALGPAGTVHCNLADWASFVSSLILKKSSIFHKDQVEVLLTPIDDYASGWGVTNEAEASGTVYTHSGSNTMWLSVVMAAPAINRAYLVITNSMDDNSDKVCDDVIKKLKSLENL